MLSAKCDKQTSAASLDQLAMSKIPYVQEGAWNARPKKVAVLAAATLMGC